MPETPYTQYCVHVRQLNQRLHDFVLGSVAQAMDVQLRNRPAPAYRRINAIQITFMRIVRWLQTLDKLDNTHDVQAVGAGARGVFELYLDLVWFKMFPQQEYLDRFCAFPDVSLYMGAKKVVDHATKKQGATKINTAPHAAFLQRMDGTPKGLMRDQVIALWGKNSKGEPKWPGHWSGEGDLRSRAEKLGIDYEDAYVQIYPTLCALVHPGPSPEVRERLSDLEWLEKQMGFGYFFAFNYARASTILVCELLDVRQHVEGFDLAMHKLDEWVREATQALPG